MTEYLYDRENPKSHFRQRLTGIEGFMFGNPNMNERADMIGRALAKETDGDFTKFVSRTQKPRDMAQKWRAFKNIARFFKNPFAYMFWKVMPLHNQTRFRFIWAFLILNLYSTFYNWLLTRGTKRAMAAKWMWSIGLITQEHGLPNEPRMPVDRKKNYVRYSNFHQMRKNKRLSLVH